MSEGASSCEKEEEEDGEERNCFNLFTASLGSLVPNNNTADSTLSTAPTTIQTAQGLRDNHALRRLQKLRNRTSTNKEYDTFVLRGPYNFAASTEVDEVWYQLLTLSATVASAIVEVFEQEASEKMKWETLQIWDCHVNDALVQVLQAAQKWGLFPSWEFRKGNPLTAHSLLTSFALNNPALRHLRLDRAVLDLAVVEFLRSLLDTKSVANQGAASSSRTRLQRLELCETAPIESDEIVLIFAHALKQNDSLKDFSLTAFGTRSMPSLLVDSFSGHPSLQTLNLSHNCFSESTIMALGRILQSPSCNISSLHLDKCQMLSPSRYVGPLRMEIVANALTQRSCDSLLKLSLQQNCASSRDLQKLLRSIYHHCPNLLELDLTHNRIERILWSASDASQTEAEPLVEQKTAGDSKSSSSVAPNPIVPNIPHLQSLWLTRNPVLHNRFRARTNSENANLERLLVDFPALGQIVQGGHTKARYMNFSSKIHTLLPFQYATRGRLLDGKLPLSMWPRVWNRIPRGVALTQAMWNCGKEDPLSNRRFRRACQASVVFLQLRQHPSLITRETCRLYCCDHEEEYVEESQLPSFGANTASPVSKAKAWRALAQTKRRKLR